jgi:hypothetical protein
MAIIVTLPYDPTWQALAWVKANCPSYITNAINEADRVRLLEYQIDQFVADIDYFFGNEKDALMFRLKWQ